MKITILGQTPAQKNSKTIAINKRTGKPFPMSNKNVKDWQKSALKQLSVHSARYTGRVQIDYMFYVRDNRIRDTDNMIATLNDALQAAKIISGDHWQVLRIGSADAAIDTANPRVEITITRLDEENA